MATRTEWFVVITRPEYNCPFKYMSDCAHVDNAKQICTYKNCPIKKEVK